MELGYDQNPFKKPATIDTSTIDNYQPYSITNNTPSMSVVNEFSKKTDELEKRQRELEAKEEELMRREQAEQIRISQEQTQSHINTDFHWNTGDKKNFPPLPKFLPCAPCFYLNIDEEIPEAHKILVRRGFHLWIAYTILTLVNFLGAIMYLIGSKGNDQGGPLLGTALFGVITIPPLSFLFWFRPLYKAFKSDSSMNFFFFFAIMSAQIIVMFLQVSSFTNFGVCGFGYLFSIKGIPWLMAVVFLISIGYLIIMICSVILIKKVHFCFRHSEANFNKARDELFRNVAKDANFRNAAKEFVVQSQNQPNPPV